VHVVFLEFVIDPACSLVFEAERSDPRIMERPPRPTRERLFTGRALALGVLLGVSVLAAVALVYGSELAAGAAENAARATAFATLVFGNLALIFANRSHALTLFEAAMHENVALWWIVAAALAALAASLYVPAVAAMFRFEAIGAGHLALAAAAGIGSVLWFDAVKIARRLHEG
jgi:Ca2+-transporting ATPase